MKGLRLAPWALFLIAGLSGTANAATGLTPDCILNTGSLNDTAAPLVNRYTQTLTKSGIVTQDPPPALGDAIFNTPLGPFNVYTPSSPLEILVQVPDAAYHVDNGRDGTVAYQQAVAGFCNLRVASDLAGGIKANLSFDTFDATSVFNQTNGSNDYFDPAGNPRLALEVERLKVENINLSFNGIALRFRDPRRFSQGSEVLVELTDAKLDLSKALSFQSVATEGQQFITRLISAGGVNEFVFPARPDQINGSGGRFEIDINNGSTFRILDTGSASSGPLEIRASVNTTSGFADASWNFLVGRDGSGGSLDIVNSFLVLGNTADNRFENSVSLYDNAQYNIQSDASSVDLYRLNVLGNNASHRVKFGDSFIRHASIEGNNMTFDVTGAGNIEFNDVQLKKGITGLNFVGSPALGAKSSTYLVSLGALGGNSALDPQLINVQDWSRGDLRFSSTSDHVALNLTRSNVSLTPFVVSNNTQINLDARSNLEVFRTPIVTSSSNSLVIALNDSADTTNFPSVTLRGSQLLGPGGLEFTAENDRKFGLQVGSFTSGANFTDILYSGLGSQSLPAGTQFSVAPLGTLAIGDACVTQLTAVSTTSCAERVRGIGSLTVGGPTFFDFLSRFEVDIGRASSGGALASDTLFYASASNLFTRQEVIVNALNISSADELNNQDFVLIAPSGTGYQSGIDPGVKLTRGANLPAAVALSVNLTESQAGRLVIRTDKDLNLLKNPAQGRNHRGLASALVNNATTIPNQTLNLVSVSGTPIQTTYGGLASTLTVGDIQTLSNAHAEAYSSYMTVQLEQTNLLSNMVMNHAMGAGRSAGYQGGSRAFSAALEGLELASNTDGATTSDLGASLAGLEGLQIPSARPRSWIDSAIVKGRVAGENGLGTFKYSATQFVAGHDLSSDDRHNFGFYLTAGHTKQNEQDSITQNLSADVAGFGLYRHQQVKTDLNWSLTGGYARAINKSARVAPDVGNLAGGLAKAKYNSDNWYVGARLQSTNSALNGSNWQWMPSVGVSYMLSLIDGFQESGANNFNFNVGKSRADSLVVSPAVDVFREFELQSGRKVFLDARLRYEYDALADKASEHFVSVSNPIFGSFQQAGQNRGAHGIALGLGAATLFEESMALGLGYEFANRENGTEHGLRANFTWFF